MGRWWWVIGVAACAPIEPAESDDPPVVHDPTVFGPYVPGVQTLRVPGGRSGELVIEVWYPARSASDDDADPYELPIVLDARRGAAADRSGAPYPLVGFSHGLGGVRYQSASLCEHLASHGYVVVSPDHDGTILLDIDWDHMNEATLARPGEVQDAIDAVAGISAELAPELAGLSAPGRYAMIGHSFGAVTTLALAGGRLDVSQLDQHCDENGGSACRFLKGVDPDELASVRQADPRIAVAVPMSPGGWYAFGAHGAGLAELPPTLVLGGTRDGVLPYADEIRPTYEAIGGPRRAATYAEAGHYSAFSDMCRLIPVFEDCDPDGGFLDAERGRSITAHLVTAFLGQEYKGESGYAAWLGAEALADYPELTMEEVP
jgi:predicted dienelactone hydrolase